MVIATGSRPEFFHAETHSRPDWYFGGMGGHYVLMLFVPDGPVGGQALALLNARRAMFDDHDRLAFSVIRDRAQYERQTSRQPGPRHFFDPKGEIARRFGMLDAKGRTIGGWVLMDPSQRVIEAVVLEQGSAIMDRMQALGSVDDYAGVPIHAPVLIIPRVLEPDLCRTLIDLYKADGGGVSGVMREVDGKTVGVVDDFKKRRDATVVDPGLQKLLQARIHRNVIPEIRRAFEYQVTRMERYIVACYDHLEGGYFRPHRDNTTKATAHRRFACSINLNADEFEGGDLRFPEFGRRTYRPPTGGAVIFGCSLLHEATPVTSGTRYAFLPFLYDDAAAQVRQENLKYLAA